MKILEKIFLAAAALLLSSAAFGQTPSPSPEGEGNYTVRSSIEIGYRWRDVNGSEQKYRSDLNYKAGLRVFDSSFMIENNRDRGMFDSILISTSGWGGDPSGYLRVNAEKAGAYRFDSNTRRVRYFNDLINHVNPNNLPSSLHNANLTHNFGDYDLTLFPESERLRIRVGYSYNRSSGPAGFTHRAYSDEFGVRSEVDAGSDDFRFGAEGKWLGFNMGINYGHRDYRDRTDYFLDAPSLGNNPTNNPRLFTFNRTNPLDGDTDYFTYFIQRTFANQLDFTGRVIYSLSKTEFDIDENATGRDNSNNFVDQDVFDIAGNAKRSQTRGDLGITWRATENFRVSNTFTFDDFDINGISDSNEDRRTRSAAGAAQAPFLERVLGQRTTQYQRFSNLIEGDYQFGNRFAVNFGYRIGRREVRIWGFDRNFRTNTTTLVDEDSENTTHAVIGGFKVKPTRDWSIFADVEHGTADNVFTRLSNYDYTNYRVRSRLGFDKFVFNVSAIAKRNDNPAFSILDPTRDFINEVRTRNFSASLDWSPVQEFNLSGGYTYLHLTSISDIRVPLTGGYQNGVSEFYVRDSYYFIDATFNFKRVSFFGSYRFDDDNGQGDRPIPPFTSPNIIRSYPMQMHSPEFRVAIKLTRNIDWNFGYQYFKYEDVFTPVQNYNAHLPYTSLRFYFGRSADR